jgi:WD40 repeat protein
MDKLFNVDTYIDLKDYGKPLGLTFLPNGLFLLVSFERCILKIDTNSKSIENFDCYSRIITLQKDPIIERKKIHALNYPKYLTFSPNGKYLLFSDGLSCIYSISTVSKLVTIFAGHKTHCGFKDGPKKYAEFNCPTDMIFTKDGKMILICDSINKCIRSICVKTGNVSVFAGKARHSEIKDGTKNECRFSYPTSMAISPNNKTLVVLDDGYYIRLIPIDSGTVSSIYVIGNTIEKFIFSNFENQLFIFDRQCIHLFNIESEEMILFAGSQEVNAFGLRNGPKEYSLFDYQSELKLSTNGKYLFCCGQENECIRVIKIKN